jgi:Bacterial membrane protein YfhO
LPGVKPGAAVRRVLPVVVPFLLAVVLFAPATVGGKVLSAADMPLFEAPFTPPAGLAAPRNPLQYDAAYVFEPDALEVRDALRSGRLPVWTDAQSAGAPLLAAQQSAPLFPLTWLGVVLPFWGALAWIAVLKLTLAGLGTALLGRALGLRAPAALLAAVTFAFGTYLVAWLMHPHANAYLLLPWMFLLADRLARRGTVRDASLLAGATGLAWLSGQPESALLVTLPTAAWFVHRLAVAPDLDRRRRIRRVVLAAAAGLAGLAMAAVMLVPLVEALRHASETSRSRPPIPFSAVLTLVAPEWWGRPDGLQVAGPSNFTERTLYAGALPTLLALAGLVVRRPDGAQRFLVVLAVVAVAISWDTGPIASVVGDVPGLAAINVTRALVLAAFALAVLAGFGLQRLADATAGERRRMLWVTAAGAAVPVVVAVAAHPGWIAGSADAVRRLLGRDLPPDPDGLAFAAVLRWLVFGALAAGIVAVARRGRTVVLAAACALAAADLLLMGAGYNPAIPKAQAEPAPTPALQALRRLTTGGGRVMGLAALEPNTASRWGLRDARGHEQPSVERVDALYTALVGRLIATPADGRLLDLFGVRAVVLAAPRPGTSGPAVPDGLRDRRVVHQGPDGTVLENRTALPEAFVAYRWRTSPDLGTSVELTAGRPAAQVRDEPVIETTDAPPAGARTAATPARIVERSDTSVTLAVEAAHPGRLVLLDTFYPGWRAEVNGRRVPIEAADAAFRAVAVPAGTHRVRFLYRPASVLAGGVVSLLALVIVGAGVALGGTARAATRHNARSRAAQDLRHRP